MTPVTPPPPPTFQLDNFSISLWFQGVQDELLAVEVLNVMREHMQRAGLQLTADTSAYIMQGYYEAALLFLEYTHVCGAYRTHIWTAVCDRVRVGRGLL